MSNYTGSDEDMAMGKMLIASRFDFQSDSVTMGLYQESFDHCMDNLRDKYKPLGFSSQHIACMLFAHHMKISGSTPADPVVSTDQ